VIPEGPGPSSDEPREMAFGEAGSDGDESLAQTGRRTTALTLDPFLIDTDEHRHQWRSLLLAVEQRLVLAGKYPGMLADDLPDYLFARSTGHIGSLMTISTLAGLGASSADRIPRPSQYTGKT
jgi:hypothetical protein